MKMKKSSYILIGSMLFGMFFGAGNLIFPVHLGQQSGANLIPANLGFLLTATGLPFLGVVAMGATNSHTLLHFSSRVNKSFGYAMTTLLYLTIGPFFALPRTATVSFEVGLAPVLSPQQTPIALAIFTALFFVLALFFALRPARILDWIGKFLNPIFLVFISVLFIIAFINPMGDYSLIAVQNKYINGAFPAGMIDGYQTMDALAALAFGGIVIKQIKALGFNDSKSITMGTIKSGFVSVILMCIIYSGLSWIGAASATIFPLSTNGGIALAQISNYYFGELGTIFLTLTISIACLKTAIGLITSCSETFAEIFPKTLTYNQYCVFFTLFSCLVSNAGLDKIIALAVPVLMLLYPLAASLILLSLLEPFIGYHRFLYVGGMIGAFSISMVDALKNLPPIISDTLFIQKAITFYNEFIPFYQYDMGWIIPASIGAAIGFFMSHIQNNQ